MKTRLSFFASFTFFSFALFSVSILSLTSCSQKANEKIQERPKDPDDIEQDIEPEAVVSMPPLSEKQMDLIKEALKKMALLPERDLLLYEESRETLSQRQEREAKIKNLQPETRKVYDRILEDCKILQPQTVLSGDPSQNPGSRFFENSAASIAGNKCPVNVERKIKSEILTISNRSHSARPSTKLLLVQEKKQNHQETLKVKLQDLQKESDLSSFTKIETIKNRVKVTDTEELSFFESETSLTGRTVGNKLITDKILIRVLSKILKTDNSVLAVKKYMKHSKRIAGLLVVGQVYVLDEEKAYYLNGKQLTESDFGQFFPDLVPRESN